MIPEIIIYILYGILIVLVGLLIVEVFICLLYTSINNPEIGGMILGVIVGIFLYIDKYYLHILV